MAYYRSEPGQHAFRRIQKDINGGRDFKTVILCGVEQYLVSWAADVLVSEYVRPGAESMDLAVLDGFYADIDVIKENCETFSMFSKKRVLKINDHPLLWKNTATGFTETYLDELIECINDLNESILLIFTGQKPDDAGGKSRLFRAVEEAGAVYDFTPLDMRTLRGFVVKRLKKNNVCAQPSVIDMMIRDSGYLNKDMDYGLYNLDNDIKKMIAHSDGVRITSDDVATAVSDNLETNVFAMIDAVSRNRKDEAYRLLNNLFASRANVFPIQKLLVAQLELMLVVKEMRNEGMNVSDMHKYLKMNEYRVKKTVQHSARVSEEKLRKILLKGYEIESNIKTGLMSDRLAMEYFIAEI